LIDLSVIIAGIAMGFAMAAPLGPVNLIVIRAALNHNTRAAIMSALGAISADTMMASIAVYGMRSIEHAITDYSRPIQIIGGVFLVYLGIRTARKHFQQEELAPSPSAARLGLTFFLTITNPGTALGFLAIFGAMESILQLGSAPYRPAMVLVGIACGGALWWLSVSLLILKLKSKFSATTLDRINRWSGILVAAFGFVLLMQAFG
jgi:threonine/homoserine/homoserine lactone efflux protein